MGDLKQGKAKDVMCLDVLAINHGLFNRTNLILKCEKMTNIGKRIRAEQESLVQKIVQDRDDMCATIAKDYTEDAEDPTELEAEPAEEVEE